MTTAIHPGLRLTAVENEDGTWNILDVPVLPPTPKGVRYNDEDIGIEWMRKTVDAARVESDMGHLGSLSVFHHPDVDLGPSSKPEYAGKILPSRVGTSRLRDEGTIPCLFVDFLFVPTSVVDRIERHELSYRSPEVRNWAKFRIDTVSLLSTEAPYNRLPMLGIGERIPFTRSEQETFESEEAFATARFQDGPPPIYRFSGGLVMPEEKKPPAKMADDEKEKKDDGEVAKLEDGALNVEAIVKAIESGEIMVKDFAAIEAAMSAAGGAGEEAPEEEALMTDEEKEEKRIANPPVQMSDDAVDLAAKVTALESFRDDVTAEKRVAKRIKTATAKFADEGKEMSARVTKDVAHFAAGLDDKQYDRYVDGVLAQTLTTPAPTFGQAAHRAAHADAPEVAKFAAGDPDKLVLARKYSGMYDDAQARGWGLTATREEYIEHAYAKQARRRA